MFFIDLDRRKVLLAGITEHPTGPWVTQQARNLLSDLHDASYALRFLIGDRDTKFTRTFDDVFGSDGASVIKTPVRSPQANAFAERFVQTVRTERLDWILVRDERQLGWILDEFVEHYNEARPHRGIDLEVPIPLQATARALDLTEVRRTDRLGGLIHEYAFAPEADRFGSGRLSKGWQRFTVVGPLSFWSTQPIAHRRSSARRDRCHVAVSRS